MELVELPVPEPKANEAVVKLAASGVNFIDVYHREGRYKVALPFMPGQEGAGVVSAVGTRSEILWKNGDRVAWSHMLGSLYGVCGRAGGAAGTDSGGGEREQAAATMLQGMTAHYLSHDTYPLKGGETALVHAAAGGVGLLLVQMAHNMAPA